VSRLPLEKKENIGNDCQASCGGVVGSPHTPSFRTRGFPVAKTALSAITTEPKYDVAISFLARDEVIAKELYGRR
jgi:hypothetical protein